MENLVKVRIEVDHIVTIFGRGKYRARYTDNVRRYFPEGDGKYDPKVVELFIEHGAERLVLITLSPFENKFYRVVITGQETQSFIIREDDAARLLTSGNGYYPMSTYHKVVKAAENVNN